MGYDFYEKEKDVKALDFIIGELYSGKAKALCFNEDPDTSVIYFAIEIEGEVHAEVISYQDRGGDGFNFGFRVLHEGMYPIYHNPSKEVLDALSPPCTDYASEWREVCRGERPRPQLKDVHD